MTACVERWTGARRCSGMKSATETIIAPRWLDWRGQPISNGIEGWGGLG